MQYLRGAINSDSHPLQRQTGTLRLLAPTRSADTAITIGPNRQLFWAVKIAKIAADAFAAIAPSTLALPSLSAGDKPVTMSDWHDAVCAMLQFSHWQQLYQCPEMIFVVHARTLTCIEISLVRRVTSK